MCKIAETSKGCRVWLQGLTAKGYSGRYTVDYGPNVICVRFHDLGKRKLCPAKGGIVDLVGKKVTIWAKGHTEASVVFNSDHIIIKRKDSNNA